MENITKVKRAKTLGIVMARCIVQGDVDFARKLGRMHRQTWGVSELRALVGACRYARERYAGCRVYAAEFIEGKLPRELNRTAFADEVAQFRKAEREARADGRYESAVFFQNLADGIERNGRDCLPCEFGR